MRNSMRCLGWRTDDVCILVYILTAMLGAACGVLSTLLYLKFIFAAINNSFYLFVTLSIIYLLYGVPVKKFTV